MEIKTIEEVAFINPDSIKKDYPYNEIEYIDIQSVGSGYLIESKLIPLSEAPSRAKRLIKDGDTILSTVRPNRRSFLYIKNPRDNVVVSTGFAVLRAKEGIDSRYFYYAVTEQKFTDYLTLCAKGAAYPAVDTEIIQKGKIPVYPIDVQQKISATLSAYDDLIENNTRRIQILEEMAQRIYKEWFVDFRFPGHEKVKFVNSELGKIPEGWEVKSIMECSTWDFINESISKYEGKKEYFATADVEGIDIVKDGILVSYDDKPSRAQKQPLLFSVWFARMKDTYKVLGFTKVNENIANGSILSSGFAGFKTSEFNFPFLYLTIKSEEFHQKKDQFCTGATQMSLTNDGLQKIKIILPSKNIIEDFGKLVLPLLNKVFVLQKINKILRTTRDLLLPKLISGELDISDLDIAIREQEE
ncbi:MAG: restriction endonuclease subunit S [Candidatus Goldbacteria bacterium]|nr:restriction endonuclease subunit S [Candidatus Goldiibacteriota bacterium]